MSKEDEKFDMHHELEFAEIAQLDELDISSENRRHGFDYVPSMKRIIDCLLSNIQQDPTDFSFIDFGSGRGRTLVHAAIRGFNEVIGVEFASELHEVAARNIAKFKDSSGCKTPISSVCCDATRFEIPDGDCVFYFCNPFSEVVMKKVLESIRRSWNKKKRFIAFYIESKLEHGKDLTRNVELLRMAPFFHESRIKYRSLKDRFLLSSHSLIKFNSTQD